MKPIDTGIPVRGESPNSTPHWEVSDPNEAAALATRIIDNVGTVIRGKRGVARDCVVALLAGGHLIIEDFPGVGKTMLAKALALSIRCRFSRIQFTPDLLPSDVTGVNIFSQKTGEFEFRPGPIFANVVLADEINRASPKTQSALLECMQERQATIDSCTYPISAPFMVIATQNPIEYEGTFPLPEAQLDRFMLRISVGYPARDDESSMLEDQTSRDPIADLRPILDSGQLLGLIESTRRVRATKAIRDYVVALMDATRSAPDFYLGASPRAGIGLVRAAKAGALLDGRDFVTPQDVKDLAVRVLSHRVILSPDGRLHGRTTASVIEKILDTVPVPSG
ncbi:MAG TPA: MoxR family ATPase [Thermoleophilia bacterium]|nr:MoxR family ATPase [Thermoleophilia bacterium]